MNKKVILCVDDEKIILNSLKKQLKTRFGSEFLYEIAESAEEGLEILDELFEDNMEAPIIVSDWYMPGIKGDEFLQRVHEIRPDIVKILLTGQADTAIIESAKKDGYLNEVFYKPWSQDELMSSIESHLGL
ncbi:response regulator [Sediminitomix flava]|uniref:Response regulator receiver domain-containing protein n=1 Tax=Sediminitomix flava TaxID=379075 RepID=A0A315ZH45_SEDFL|nr:response regulator [Sediminitomix flava]PWJ44168.1 response regulator receiver domain-containing protein [Sediminitomix flava]